MPDVIAAPAAEESVGSPTGQSAGDGDKPSGLTKDEVNSMIEAALGQRVGPLNKTLRQLQADKEQKINPVVEENRSLTQRLQQIEAERISEKAQARDTEITGQLERALLSKSIPEDCLEMVVDHVKKNFGSQFDLDGKRKLIYKDQYGEVGNFSTFVENLVKSPVIGRLIPPVDTPSGRALRGNSQHQGGSKPPFAQLTREEQFAMNSAQKAEHALKYG